ncbi:MAG TPA: HAMP domain-containing sensor histidine kinase [Acidimicrobiales bacterium]|nr:HAMP domain-containing sensor histidine kinase [Acidimicrobiales bacterium]
MVPLSLRLRAIVGFGAVSLLLAGTLSLFTYALVRNWIVDDRRSGAVHQAYTSARLVGSRIRSGGTDFAALLSGLQATTSGHALIERDGKWYASSVSVDPAQVPASLQAVVADDHAGWQTVGTARGPVLAIGVPVAEASARLYLLEPLDDIQHTLGVLAGVLAAGAGVATAVGAGTGALVSRRILRPLRDVSAVARDIVDGRHDARLAASGGDPDLEPLVVSFNRMVDELEERARREARFAADVSHDLRGPLAAFAAAVSVVQRRRATLPPEACAAVDLLDQEVQAFARLVSDLLEISRFEAGTAALHTDRVDVVELVGRVLVDTNTDVPVAVDPPGYRPWVSVDRRRMHQVFANLFENADRYAGGATRVVIGPAPGGVAVAVEDHGPGVPEELRQAIFSRYERGRAAHDPSMPRGTGLGLALATQHARLHGGSIRVDDAPDGGARFVIELPEVP